MVCCHVEDVEDEMRLCLEGGLATTEVPLSWSPCVEDGGDQLQPPAMLSHTDRVYRYNTSGSMFTVYIIVAPASLLVAPI